MLVTKVRFDANSYASIVTNSVKCLYIDASVVFNQGGTFPTSNINTPRVFTLALATNTQMTFNTKPVFTCGDGREVEERGKLLEISYVFRQQFRLKYFFFKIRIITIRS